MNPPHRIAPKSTALIAREWDAIASVRSQQLESQIDPSYEHILVPTVLDLLGGRHRSSTVLDVGSGTGVLTALLASEARRVVGIDPSSASVVQARHHGARKNVRERLEFHAQTIEEFQQQTDDVFPCVVANMTLMDSPNVTEVVHSIALLTAPQGIFVWTITHPWFWPRYWGYENEPWFSYDKELFIESEFKISNARTGLVSTHIHRPLELYTRLMAENGFAITALQEPMPGVELMAKYPQAWEYPRFLAIRCERPAPAS